MAPEIVELGLGRSRLKLGYLPARKVRRHGGRYANCPILAASPAVAGWAGWGGIGGRDRRHAGPRRSRAARLRCRANRSFEDNPNVTDKKFPGNPARSYRTRAPLVVEEVTDWTRLTPEAIETWRGRLAALRDIDAEIIN